MDHPVAIQPYQQVHRLAEGTLAQLSSDHRLDCAADRTLIKATFQVRDLKSAFLYKRHVQGAGGAGGSTEVSIYKVKVSNMRH